MVVYTLFSAKHAAILRLWSLSWERRGWETRLLTPRDIVKYGSVKRAMKTRKGLFVDPTVINFDFRPRRKTKLPRIVKSSTRHWDVMPLVKFPTEGEVLRCGRAI